MTTLLIGVAQGYWLLVGVAVALHLLVVAVIASPPQPAQAARDSAGGWIYLTMTLLLVAGRWPSLWIPSPQNPDESIMLAQAMKFAQDPMPWRAVDTGTGGPVNSYLLVLGAWLTGSFGYPTARAVAIGCILIHVLLLHAALRRITDPLTAAFSITPGLFFFALATDNNFLHYASELPSLALLSGFLWVICTLQPGSVALHRERARCLAAGLLAFLLAMSKLQVLPLAAVSGALLLVHVSASAGEFLRRAAWMAAAALTCVLLLLLLLAWGGVLSDFYTSFVLLPFAYQSAPLTPAAAFEFLLSRGESRMLFAAFIMGAWVIVLLPLTRLLNVAWGELLLRFVSVFATLYAGYVTVATSGRDFQHYLNYVPAVLAITFAYLSPNWTRPQASPPGAAA